MENIYRARMMLLMLYSVLLANCNNSNNVKKSDQLTDSTKKSSKDSISTKSVTQDETEIKNNVEEYEKGYSKRISIDTSIALKGDTFQLQLNHYCLFDKRVHVPKKYTEIYGLDSFVSHSFQSDIVLKEKDRLIVKKSIHKNDFDDLIDSSLRMYGVLLYPEIRILSNEIQIGYSLSIPLTDVGKAVKVSINEKGRITFGGDN